MRDCILFPKEGSAFLQEVVCLFLELPLAFFCDLFGMSEIVGFSRVQCLVWQILYGSSL